MVLSLVSAKGVFCGFVGGKVYGVRRSCVTVSRAPSNTSMLEACTSA
jgi:hypothetical protein